MATCDEGSFIYTKRESFVEAMAAGVRMDVVRFTVDELVSDLILPIACEFASSMVVAHVSSSMPSLVIPHSSHVACNVRIGLVPSTTCFWG